MPGLIHLNDPITTTRTEGHRTMTARTKPTPWDWDLTDIESNPEWGYNEIFADLWNQAEMNNYTDILPEDIEREAERIMGTDPEYEPPTCYVPGFGWEYL